MPSTQAFPLQALRYLSPRLLEPPGVLSSGEAAPTCSGQSGRVPREDRGLCRPDPFRVLLQRCPPGAAAVFRNPFLANTRLTMTRWPLNPEKQYCPSQTAAHTHDPDQTCFLLDARFVVVSAAQLGWASHQKAAALTVPVPSLHRYLFLEITSLT